jgi:hypothetical protein
VKAKRTIHVLTDKKGAILGGGILTSAQDQDGKAVHIQIAPMKGQTISEVPMPREIQRLKGAEVFRRLQSDFHLPGGEKELLRKPVRR